MTLYVDNARIPFGRMKMSHLAADTSEELLEAARQLGLSKYIQHNGEPKEHLDVSLSKRAEAIQKLGAKEVPSKELIYLMRRKRDAGAPD